MKHINLAVFALICIGIFVVNQMYVHSTAKPIATKSDAIGDFSYTDINGHTGTLHALTGTTVVHFWATWCAPCREEMPLLLETAVKKPEINFLIISADTNEKAMHEFMQPYAELLKSKNIILIFDPKTEIADGYFDVKGFPESYILDNNKSVKQFFRGGVPWPTIDFTAN